MTLKQYKYLKQVWIWRNHMSWDENLIWNDMIYAKTLLSKIYKLIWQESSIQELFEIFVEQIWQYLNNVLSFEKLCFSAEQAISKVRPGRLPGRSFLL